MTIRCKVQWLSVLGVSMLLMIILSEVAITSQKRDKKEPEATPKVVKTARQHLMDGKLVNSQEVLRGLVLSDFERIEKSATALNVLTLAEEWVFSNSQEYKRLSEDLRRITRQLVKAGKDKNIDAAAMAYQRMTLNCVECHQALREGFK